MAAVNRVSGESRLRPERRRIGRRSPDRNQGTLTLRQSRGQVRALSAAWLDRGLSRAAPMAVAQRRPGQSPVSGESVPLSSISGPRKRGPSATRIGFAASGWTTSAREARPRGTRLVGVREVHVRFLEPLQAFEPGGSDYASGYGMARPRGGSLTAIIARSQVGSPRRSAAMKVAVLAGGQGTRLAEETRVKSKAMVRIGDAPILWHLLKYYEHYGYTRFVIALGYHGELDQGLLLRPWRPHRAGERRAADHSVAEGGAEVDGRAGRHRPRDHVGRADQAPGALSRRGGRSC